MAEPTPDGSTMVVLGVICALHCIVGAYFAARQALWVALTAEWHSMAQEVMTAIRDAPLHLEDADKLMRAYSALELDALCTTNKSKAAAAVRRSGALRTGPRPP